nr:putative ribonuclease H-like domain-containing protein [Tanacetum cinerariifolium]
QTNATVVPPGCIPVPTGNVLVPPGSLPVPTGSIPVPADATMVSTDDVPVHTSSSTDLIFDDAPTTRFSCPSDLGNHDPSCDFQHCMFACFLSQVEPRSVAHALKDPSWVDAMQEEMQQFKF